MPDSDSLDTQLDRVLTPIFESKKDAIREVYLLLAKASLELYGTPIQADIVEDLVWSIIKYHPEISTFFTGDGINYYGEFTNNFNLGYAPKRLKEKIMEKLRNEFPDDFEGS